jgi:hypothetical protein
MRSLTRRHVLHLGTSSIALAAVEALGGGALAVGAAGCGETVRWAGVDVSSGQRIDLSAGPMPFGGTFAGKYLSPQCGRLELVQSGAGIAGSYRSNDDPRAVGTLMGKVTGNLAEFHWFEHELPGDADPSFEGTGFFLLDSFTPVPGSARLFGRRTFVLRDGDWQTITRDGGPWTAVRVV